MLLVKKCDFFLYLFSVKKGLEIKFNAVLDRKQTFLDHKNKIFQRLKKRIFPKELTHAFGQKWIFFFISFRSKKTRNKVYDVLDRKETFYDYKNNNFLTTQKWHFFKGVNPCFDRIMQFCFLCFRSKKN